MSDADTTPDGAERGEGRAEIREAFRRADETTDSEGWMERNIDPLFAAPDARQGEGGGETDVVRADYWPDYLLGRVIDEIENSDAFDYSSVIKSNTLARLRHLQQQLPRSPDALQGEGDEPAEGYGMTAREYYGQLADRGGYLAALDAAIQEIERLRRLRAPQREGDESTRLTFSCPHCGTPSARPMEPKVDIHSGAIYRCSECGCGVVFSVEAPSDYASRLRDAPPVEDTGNIVGDTAPDARQGEGERIDLPPDSITRYVVEPCVPDHDCDWVAWEYGNPQNDGTGETPTEAIRALTADRRAPQGEGDEA